jgi:putative transposase
MARAARIFVENACHHMVARGIQKDVIFKDKEDFESYLGLMHKYKVKFGCRIYSYCLMNNHVHLVAEFPLGIRSMISFMHGLNQTYAMLFNVKYDRVGHLWQNRYKNYIVLKEGYLLNLVSYIEFNPVRAGFVTKPEKYPWSSYRARVLGEKNIILDQI